MSANDISIHLQSEKNSSSYMSRLYLILCFLGCVLTSVAQNNLKKYLEFAQEQYDKGDYFYALSYYQQAMEIDSNTVDILWKFAETQRAYKEYRKAEYYYAKVYDREEARIYPSSLLNLGLMQKQNGKYEEALTTFKKAKKKYFKDKKGYLYKKSKRELESLVWVKSTIVDTADVSIQQLPETVNTKNSEFGHGIFNNELIFSSLRGDSVSAIEEVYGIDYKTSIYKSKMEEQEFLPSEQIQELFIEKLKSLVFSSFLKYKLVLFFISILQATFFVVVSVKKLFPICCPSSSIINVFTIISVFPLTNLVGRIIMGIYTVSFGFAVCI